MEKSIQHIHVRRFTAPLADVVAAIDQLWSGSPRDAVPPELHGWRRSPAGTQGFAVGTRFGHGPFSFHVEQWDGESLRARIETAGYTGHHGFTLRAEGSEVLVTHDLAARLTLPKWLFWQLFIARGHDWAVEALLDRMHVLLHDPLASSIGSRRPPLGLRLFAALRRVPVVRRRAAAASV
jgi:hypothetical protein